MKYNELLKFYEFSHVKRISGKNQQDGQCMIYALFL